MSSIAAFRQRPGMYLGAQEGTRRLQHLIAEGLTAVSLDASFSSAPLVQLAFDRESVRISHQLSNTPLTRPHHDLQDYDAVVTAIGAQAQKSGVPPWSSWVGMPLVNALSEEFHFLCRRGPHVSLLRYRRGNSVDAAEFAEAGGMFELEIRFKPDSLIFGPESGSLPEAVNDLLGTLPDDVSRTIIVQHSTRE